jgi:hypothetical protein
MLESKKSIHFFGTCSQAPFAGVRDASPADWESFSSNGSDAHSIILSLRVKLMKIGAVFPRIEATQ